MILRDPSLEKSHYGKYYALYFEAGMPLGYANNCA